MPDTLSTDQAETINPDIMFVGDDEALSESTQAEPETPDEQVTEETTQTDQEGQEPEEQPEEIETKKKHKLEQRFSEITRKKNDALRAAESERLAREKVEAELALYKNQQVESEPQYENFADPLEYAKALAQYERKKATIETEKRIKEQQETQRIKETQARWVQKEQIAKAQYSDYDLVIESATDTQISSELQNAILESDIGPDLLYHLANNDTLVAKLASLPTTSALRELGKIEASIEYGKNKPKLVKGTTQAPEPIRPIKQTSTVQQSLLPKGDIQVDQLDNYRALRQAGKIR